MQELSQKDDQAADEVEIESESENVDDAPEEEEKEPAAEARPMNAYIASGSVKVNLVPVASAEDI